MNNKAQFTPGPWYPHLAKADHCLSSSVWGAEPGNQVAVIGGKSLQTMNANAHLIAAAPAMYEALSDAEGMWNIARLIDSKHHAGNPIPNDLWSDFHQYLMEWYAKRKAALAQAEGRQA